MTSPAEGLLRLRAAAETGALDAVCARHAVSVLTVFGSVLRTPETARDLDVAALPVPGGALDLPALVVALTDLTGTQHVDVADLGRADPVLRERALVGCLPLFEGRSGAFAAAQAAAVGERVDTDANRRLNLALLAS
jgi:predicted nucleotidyltransferase